METYIHWLLIGNVPDLENIVDLRLHNFLFKQLYYSSLFVTAHPGNFGNNPRENLFFWEACLCKYFSHSGGTSAPIRLFHQATSAIRDVTTWISKDQHYRRLLFQKLQVKKQCLDIANPPQILKILVLSFYSACPVELRLSFHTLVSNVSDLCCSF